MAMTVMYARYVYYDNVVTSGPLVYIALNVICLSNLVVFLCR